MAKRTRAEREAMNRLIDSTYANAKAFALKEKGVTESTANLFGAFAAGFMTFFATAKPETFRTPKARIEALNRVADRLDVERGSDGRIKSIH